MAGSLNKAMVLGNLGADPIIRSTSSGAKVASFSVATSEKWKDRNSNEMRERTEWHRITLWGDGLVGVVERYLRKGSKVYIEGEIRTRKWTDSASGQERYTTEIVVQGPRSQMVMLSGGGAGGGGAGGGGEFYDGDAGAQQGAASAGGGAAPPPHEIEDDDIPF